ncbi:DUF6809 family protein [Bacillus fonticola]|uniref:DUF6809 family protein n=1 Tax=Bacillus fonticola TaxID=2728853 RepID=UPI001474F50E|nr:DUF6809 family protein [Bacillus fonticola]
MSSFHRQFQQFVFERLETIRNLPSSEQQKRQLHIEETITKLASQMSEEQQKLLQHLQDMYHQEHTEEQERIYELGFTDGMQLVHTVHQTSPERS